MTDLTEKWKNGELEEDFYYIVCDGLDDGSIEITIDKYESGFVIWNDNAIKQILAPVPSYEEWQKLKEENRALAMGSFPMMLEAAKKIDKLKELLKECSPYVSRSATGRMIKNSIGHKKDMKLLTQIDEVLK